MNTNRWIKRHIWQYLSTTSLQSKLRRGAGVNVRLLLLPIFVLLALLALPAISSAARNMYVANERFVDPGDPDTKFFSVSQYDIKTISGGLAPVAPMVVDEGEGPRSIVVHPDGTSAYVANSKIWSFAGVSQYDIDSDTGTLTPKDSLPVEIDGFPQDIAISPDGKSAYIANAVQSGNGSVSQYNIDSATRALTPKDSPAMAAGAAPIAIAVHPKGGSVYVVNAGDSSISHYDVDPDTGALTLKDVATVGTGMYPSAITVHPNGESAYVTNYFGNTVSQYDIVSTAEVTGVLKAKDPPTVGTGVMPIAIAIRPGGKSAYVANFDGRAVSQYDISLTGALQAKDPEFVPAGVGLTAVAISPNGRSAYVTNKGDDTVSQYEIDPDGFLTAKSPETVATGLEPQDIAMAPNQGPTARFTVDVGAAGEPTNFDASSSADPDGSLVRYRWDFGDGTFPMNAGLTPSHTYNSAGSYDVTLTVTDNEGCSIKTIFTGKTTFCNGSPRAKINETITVTDPPPVNVSSPTVSGTPHVGETLTCFEGEWDKEPVNFTYQWLRDDLNILGATDSTYTLVAADAGSSITCQVTASTAAGVTSATSSAVSVTVPSSPPTPPGPAPSPSPLLGPAPSPSAQTASFSEACNLKITSPKLRATKTNVMRVSTSKIKRLFTHGVKGTMRWGTINGKDVVCKKIKMVLLQQRGRSYYIPGTRTRVSKKILTGKTFSTRGASFLKKKKVGKLRKKTRSSKRLTKISYKDFNRRSKRGRSALNSLRKKGYHGRFLVLYNAEIDGTTVLKKIRLRT